MDQQKLTQLPKEHLVDTIAEILRTGVDLDFLLELRHNDLEILVTCVRDWALWERKWMQVSRPLKLTERGNP